MAAALSTQASYAPRGRHAANMLIPQAYDAAWTDLSQPFNYYVSPGDAGTAGTAAGAATGGPAAVASVANFPSFPNAPGDRDWNNPQSAMMLQLGPSSSGQVLAANPKRTLLIIQNNSASGGATFWVAFGQAAVQYGSIALGPGQSLTLDAAVPRDSVNLLVTGASGLTAGVIVQASYVPPGSAPPPPGNIGAEAWGYVTAPLHMRTSGNASTAPAAPLTVPALPTQGKLESGLWFAPEPVA